MHKSIWTYHGISPTNTTASPSEPPDQPRETNDSVVEFCRRVWAHSDATIDALPLDAVGEVPGWPEGGREFTLHRALVHVIVDIYRHADHADLLSELIDGTVGADRR